MASKQLRRSKSEGIITGLCAGIGDYFDIDPWIVRIIFIVSAIGFIPYLILSIFIPSRQARCAFVMPSRITSVRSLRNT